jgi:metallophosphoesterase superfamily enzyme
MKTRTVEIPSDHAYLLVVSDLHVGDKAFGKESRAKLRGLLEWVKETPNARIILNGDLLNTATRMSKTSPFEQDMTLEEQVNTVARFFEPVKDRIIGAVCGNHEKRIMDFAGYDPTLSILTLLGLSPSELYFKHCGVIKVKVGRRPRPGGPWPRPGAAT